jgi:hypothetical protein
MMRTLTAVPGGTSWTCCAISRSSGQSSVSGMGRRERSATGGPVHCWGVLCDWLVVADGAREAHPARSSREELVIDTRPLYDIDFFACR